jgi:hypothetical protein
MKGLHLTAIVGGIWILLCILALLYSLTQPSNIPLITFATNHLLPLSPPSPPSPPPHILLNIPSPAEPNVHGRYAVATLISLTNNYCYLAFLMYRNIRRLDPTMQYHFIVMYQTTHNDSFLHSNMHCKELVKWSKRGNVRFLPLGDDIQRLIAQPWIHISHDEWKTSMNRMAIWKEDQYDRILYLDADILIHRSFDNFFQLPYDLAFGIDVWTSCQRSAKANGGVMLVRPSRSLYATFVELLQSSTLMDCLSGVLEESDQELVNCMCGFGRAGYARTPEFTCALLPWYTDVMPTHAQCHSYNVSDVIMVHYAGPTKPWKGWSEEKLCAKHAAMGTHNQSMEWFEHEHHRLCYERGTALFTLWLCYSHGQSDPYTLDQYMQPETMPDCQLVNLDPSPNHRSPLHPPGQGW